VEDEDHVRVLTRTLLRKSGYNVIECVNGVDALRTWRTKKRDVNLVLTDLMMPGGVTGDELARRLKADRPDLKVLLMSGYVAEAMLDEVREEFGDCFLQKPFSAKQILAMVRKRLESD
jgi:CheY-like chemotaxis protein